SLDLVLLLNLFALQFKAFGFGFRFGFDLVSLRFAAVLDPFGLDVAAFFLQVRFDLLGIGTSGVVREGVFQHVRIVIGLLFDHLGLLIALFADRVRFLRSVVTDRIRFVAVRIFVTAGNGQGTGHRQDRKESLHGYASYAWL